MIKIVIKLNFWLLDNCKSNDEI